MNISAIEIKIGEQWGLNRGDINEVKNGIYASYMVPVTITIVPGDVVEVAASGEDASDLVNKSILEVVEAIIG